MTIEDIKNVIIQHPTLGADGINTKENPNELTNYLEACNICCDWLSSVKRTKHPNSNTSNSYGLKHRVESWYKQLHKNTGRCSIPNGAFIAAAYYMGFIVKPRCLGSINAYINISSRSVPSLY